MFIKTELLLSIGNITQQNEDYNILFCQKDNFVRKRKLKKQ